MLKLMREPELQSPATAGSAVAAAAPTPSAPVPVRRPPLSWRLRQAAKLCSPGRLPRPKSASPVSLLVWCFALLAWPFTADVLVPVLARIARSCGLMVAYCELRLQVLHRDAEGNLVAVTDYGLASRKLITDAGVAYLCNDMNAASGSADITNFKYHGFGTGTGAESASDTALGTEFTTEYAVNSTRPTGSQASSTNTYTTVATFSPDSGGTLAVTEHGVFSASSSTTLWDRSKFSAVNLVATSDSLQATHISTFPSGG